MKRLILFYLLLLSGATFASPPVAVPQLSFRFANPRIIRTGTPNADYFQFDVQVRSDQVGYYIWGSTIKLNFNNSALNPAAAAWVVNTAGTFTGHNSYSLASPKYTVSATITGTTGSKVCNIALTGDPKVGGNGPNSNDFTMAPAVYTSMVTVQARLALGNTSGDAFAGMDFYEFGMNGAINQQYIVDGGDPFADPVVPPTIASFNSINLYDPSNFVNTYTGRIYSTLFGWSQVGGATAEVQYLNWATAVHTSVWEGDAFMPSGVANATALRIDSTSTLTIPVDGQVTVSGTPGSTTVYKDSGLTISSSALGTGSLITGSITGTGSAQNYLTTGRWHLVSSPVVETVAAFLTANSNVPNNLPTNANRGMMDYNPGSNSWNAFFTDGVSAGSAGSGKGYCLRSAANGIVTFTGTLQAGTLHATGLTSNAFNCVGNPYTSAIGINQTATSSNNFLGVNSANLDATYGAVYLWDNADAQNGTGAYTAVSNVPSATIANIAQGQGFMVKMASASQLDFNGLMQVHAPSLALKSANKVWPTIRLTATVNNIQNSTVIAYDGGMSKGLDPTYDAGLFKGGADLVIYTKLVEDSATPLAIQALPDNNFDGMIIPVGVDSKTGGQVVFSAETFSLPSGVKVILEDKVAKTFTDLATTTYKAVLVPNSIVADRFQLHNSTSTIQGNIGDPTLGGKLTAYAYMNSEIRIVGQVSKDAVATLYDVQGKSVIITKLAEGSLNVIPISSVSTGLYLLSVKDGVNSQSFKILLKD